MACRSRLTPLGPVVLACLFCGAFSAPAVAAPANDDFAHAAPLTGFPVELEASNAGATSEPNEPEHGYPGSSASGGHSVWWRWTPDRGRHVSVWTCGSTVDTAFSVYTGASLEALSAIGGTGDSAGRCDNENAYGARVAFFATAGRAYYVAVDSTAPPDDPGGAFGSVRLAIRGSASVTVRTVAGKNGTLAKLVYRAAPGERNNADIYLDWDPSDSIFTELPEPPSPPVSYWIDEEVSPGEGCERRSSGGVNCAIPDGAAATGPLVLLGDRSDSAGVGFSRAGTQVVGGRGDDGITASGQISGGPGDDELNARTWGRSQISGGPGNDMIVGSRRQDVIDPGPGEDLVDARFAFQGNDVVRTRDGDIDLIDCAGGVAFIDGMDVYGPHCDISRRGAPRAVPESIDIYLEDGIAQVDVNCPADGPRVCVGSLTATAPGVTLRRGFRVRREDPRFGEVAYLEFRASERDLRRLARRVKVTVRSRDNAGNRRTATRISTGVGIE